MSNYWCDAGGKRTVKTSGESEEMYVNSLFSGGNTQTANFTAYANPYFVVSKGVNTSSISILVVSELCLNWATWRAIVATLDE